jgi:hypothetical protein
VHLREDAVEHNQSEARTGNSLAMKQQIFLDFFAMGYASLN